MTHSPNDQAAREAKRSHPIISPEEIAELERLEKNATPGPWMTRAEIGTGWGMFIAGTAPNPENKVYAQPAGGSFPGADKDLIIAMRNHLPSLLAEIKRGRKALTECVVILETVRPENDWSKLRAIAGMDPPNV